MSYPRNQLCIYNPSLKTPLDLSVPKAKFLRKYITKSFCFAMQAYVIYIPSFQFVCVIYRN